MRRGDVPRDERVPDVGAERALSRKVIETGMLILDPSGSADSAERALSRKVIETSASQMSHGMVPEWRCRKGTEPKGN